MRRQSCIDLYGSAAEVGRIVSQLDAASPDFAPQVGYDSRPPWASLAVQPGKVSALKSLTDIHLRNASTTRACCWRGWCRSCPSRDAVCLHVSGGQVGEPTTIVFSATIRGRLFARRRTALVGRVVGTPPRTCRGSGDAPQVVLLGCAVPVPKAEWEGEAPAER